MTCKVDDCDRPVKRHGWCYAHWRRVQRHGDPQTHIPVKVAGKPEPRPCEHCGQPIPINKRSAAVYARARYCTPQCAYAAREAEPCQRCGKKIPHWERHPGYCSAKCQNAASNRPAYWVPTVDTPCRDGRPEDWVPEHPVPHMVRLAAAACSGCPVISDCYAAGVRQKEWGVWGGVLLSEGRPLYRQLTAQIRQEYTR